MNRLFPFLSGDFREPGSNFRILKGNALATIIRIFAPARHPIPAEITIRIIHQSRPSWRFLNMHHSPISQQIKPTSLLVRCAYSSKSAATANDSFYGDFCSGKRKTNLDLFSLARRLTSHWHPSFCTIKELKACQTFMAENRKVSGVSRTFCNGLVANGNGQFGIR